MVRYLGRNCGFERGEYDRDLLVYEGEIEKSMNLYNSVTKYLKYAGYKVLNREKETGEIIPWSVEKKQLNRKVFHYGGATTVVDFYRYKNQSNKAEVILQLISNDSTYDLVKRLEHKFPSFEYRSGPHSAVSEFCESVNLLSILSKCQNRR